MKKKIEPPKIPTPGRFTCDGCNGRETTLASTDEHGWLCKTCLNKTGAKRTKATPRPLDTTRRRTRGAYFPGKGLKTG